MASARLYSTICFDGPAESRNASALKLDVRIPIRRRYPLAMKHVCTTTQALAVQQRRHHYEREPNQTGGGALRPSKVLLMLNLEGDEQISRRNHDACDRVEGPTLADRLATPILNLHRRRQDCDRNLSLQVFRSAGTSPITVAPWCFLLHSAESLHELKSRSIVPPTRGSMRELGGFNLRRRSASAQQRASCPSARTDLPSGLR